MKKEKENKKVIYYEDELNDEFSKARIKTKLIDERYRYINDGWLWKLRSFFWYRIMATPIAFVYCKSKFKIKVVNKSILKGAKGCFVYGNHTQQIADAFIPNIISYPKKIYVIVHPNNVSMPVLGKITPKMGALPLPSNVKAAKNFVKAIERRIDENSVIMVYPEAHIWPYYTKIRPFKSASFRYPIKLNVASYCITTTYQQKKNSTKPIITAYVDGPFYADEGLSGKEKEENLKNKIYNTMVERSKNSTYEYIKYVKRESSSD